MMIIIMIVIIMKWEIIVGEFNGIFSLAFTGRVEVEYRELFIGGFSAYYIAGTELD